MNNSMLMVVNNYYLWSIFA